MIEYGHPSTSSNILDESTVLITAAAGATVLYAAGFTDTGISNKPVKVNSPGEFIFKFGFPNFKRHGQTIYNVMQWLNNGGSVVFTRLLPYINDTSTDARPATHSGLVVMVGIDNTGSTTKKIKVLVRALGVRFSAATDAAELLILDKEQFKIQSVTASINGSGSYAGYTLYPVFGFISRNKGASARKLKLSMFANNTGRALASTKYTLNITDGNVGIREPNLTVSLDPEAVDADGNSLFLEDVLEEFSTLVDGVVNRENLDIVYNYINADPLVSKYLDPIYKTERIPGVAYHAGVTLDTGSSTVYGANNALIALGGGSDGTYLGGNSKDNLLMKAYGGTGDVIDPVTGISTSYTYFSDINNKDKFPIDVILDANYIASVKLAISQTCVNRGDCVAFLDTGLSSSSIQAILRRQQFIPVNNYYTSVYTQDGRAADPYGNTRLRLTSTYELARKIPVNDNLNGLHTTISGLRRGSVESLTDLTWTPDVDAREALYNEQINYIQEDSDGRFFMTDATSQEVYSALSEMPNVRVLLSIRRSVDRLAKQILREQQTATTYSSLETAIDQGVLAKWRNNGALQTGSVKVYSSQYDRQIGTARVRIELQFTGFVKRVVSDLVVKRTA